jgi:hypothetical protein
LKFPALLFGACVIMITMLLITRAMRWYFVAPLGLVLISLSGFVLYVAYSDWHDEYYLVTNKGVLRIHYHTPLRYSSTRQGDIADLQSAWVVRRGPWEMLTNHGDVNVQVGWSRYPFSLRDVYEPYQVVKDLKELAEHFGSGAHDQPLSAIDASQNQWRDNV